ncbi:HlyD family efflux transporter periplasmic adaptor subunit [Synechococcus sp. RS9902]|uniref:HlyD family efflux transporter periplasmic adaptor subunit n=1 Tax=Synechococcus sp. RS9902 TaxID=221345 RepID=UPI0016473A0A|nr:HlyD family efflux transporter periplasmic adaptor subunit [Synechococcus sp. RS9902]QNI96551.1 hlyD secretion family protein [Synechococcus sp. RS9902]
MAAIEPQPEQRPNPFIEEPSNTVEPTPKPWSFSQPVLLKKTNRNRNVLVWSLVGSVTFAGVWSAIAPLQETVAVSGKLQPIQAVQDIEALVPGVVETVLVNDGERVAQGDVLLRFDSRAANARLEAARSNRDRLQNQVAINRVILGEQDAAKLTANQQLQLLNQRRQQTGENNAASEALARSRVRLQGLHQALATAENIAQRYQSLLADGATSALQALESQAKVDKLRSEVQAEEREVARLEATARATISGNEAELRKAIETNLRAIADLSEEIEQTNVLISNIEVTAPVGGTVFDVSVSRGSVVQPQGEAKPLLKIIPAGPLQAKVYLPNSAIGFIQPGQRADVGLTSFPRDEYGFIPATVQRIGSDALTSEEQQRVLGTSAQGLHFPAVLKLERQTLKAGRRNVPLQPGMSLTADVFLRERRFISTITGAMEKRLRSLERLR